MQLCQIDKLFKLGLESCGIMSPVCQGEDTGAVCGNGEPAKGSTPADYPDSPLCCPLQSAQGTASENRY